MSDKIKITVYRPGTHAGKRYTPGPDGVELEVTESQAKVLRDRGADKPIDADARPVADGAPSAPVVPAGAGVGAGNSVPETPADKVAPATRAPRG